MNSSNRLVWILFILQIFIIGQITAVWSIGEEQRIQREWDSIQNFYRTLPIIFAIAIIAISITAVRKLRVRKKKNYSGNDHLEKDDKHDSKR